MLQYTIRRFIVRSRKVSKPRDSYLEFQNRFEIWQAHRQHCCRRASQISKRCDNLNYQSRGFETSQDFTIRCLIGYWNGAQAVNSSISQHCNRIRIVHVSVKGSLLFVVFCWSAIFCCICYNQFWLYPAPWYLLSLSRKVIGMQNI